MCVLHNGTVCCVMVVAVQLVCEELNCGSVSLVVEHAVPQQLCSLTHVLLPCVFQSGLSAKQCPVSRLSKADLACKHMKTQNDAKLAPLSIEHIPAS